jgi:hypothetical protein
VKPELCHTHRPKHQHRHRSEHQRKYMHPRGCIAHFGHLGRACACYWRDHRQECEDHQPPALPRVLPRVLEHWDRESRSRGFLGHGGCSVTGPRALHLNNREELHTLGVLSCPPVAGLVIVPSPIGPWAPSISSTLIHGGLSFLGRDKGVARCQIVCSVGLSTADGAALDSKGQAPVHASGSMDRGTTSLLTRLRQSAAAVPPQNSEAAARGRRWGGRVPSSRLSPR